mmetsp:Transcript_59262/g.80960  ORF Transcript_59262/g.80960 Transcript_59262/m.80960 type:complete len:216 (-) Transcript_59262:404-1051(-)
MSSALYSGSQVQIKSSSSISSSSPASSFSNSAIASETAVSSSVIRSRSTLVVRTAVRSGPSTRATSTPPRRMTMVGKSCTLKFRLTASRPTLSALTLTNLTSGNVGAISSNVDMIFTHFFDQRTWKTAATRNPSFGRLIFSDGRIGPSSFASQSSALSTSDIFAYTVPRAVLSSWNGHMDPPIRGGAKQLAVVALPSSCTIARRENRRFLTNAML